MMSIKGERLDQDIDLLPGEYMRIKVFESFVNTFF